MILIFPPVYTNGEKRKRKKMEGEDYVLSNDSFITDESSRFSPKCIQTDLNRFGWLGNKWAIQKSMSSILCLLLFVCLSTPFCWVTLCHMSFLKFSCWSHHPLLPICYSLYAAVFFFFFFVLWVNCRILYYHPFSGQVLI